ncbi:energy-coupling factor ABC transporter ATP-binding protein [Salinibacterium sp. SYSU T00001]|uniref:ABC transporter ATP-binding protein n=1 Tax=Homoserinimonas sedimenticola TaxID=2986805 RepID=UPI002236B1C0|nr:ABC transporter ATP-binding protein [Salinibacterium sedimenticola]MCW4384231.1 energy-coupling factor ABC transporter ATP-binding protein [Salinibacterium sedimenticola]
MTDAAATGARVSARGWGWRHAGRPDWAVRDLDLLIEPGERVLLLGASGSGKSTLMHGLAGVLGGEEEGEASGELEIDGSAPANQRGTAGLVLQDPDSQVILARVGDDIAFGCENLGVPREETWRRVGEALETVGLDLALEHPTSALSGGQKQRLALAGVLAMQPRLLLLDEPTANLDPEGVREVVEATRRVLDRTGATLLVVEHRVAVWRGLVDRVVVLGAEGGVLADGSPEQVLTGEGEALAASGIWVPAHPPRRPQRRNIEAGPPLLSTEALAVARTRGDAVQSGVELFVAAGQALVLTGPNGVGKSTVALTLAGLLPPAEGTVHAHRTLAGRAGAHPIRWRSRELLTRIGTVFQDPEHQLLTGRVREELAVGLRALKLGASEIEERVDELLARLRLAHLADANPFTLSGGEKRRLSVATMLATRPPLLVLDEPTFGQDSRTWEELVAMFAGLLDDGSAIVMATHDEELIEALATRTHALTPQREAVLS